MGMVERMTRTFVWTGEAFETASFDRDKKVKVRPKVDVTVDGNEVVKVNLSNIPNPDGDGDDWNAFARVVRECDGVVNRIRAEAKLIADE